MNKILNINLGGMPFTIDIDAYNELDTYLSTIRRHFSDSESCELEFALVYLHTLV